MDNEINQEEFYKSKEIDELEMWYPKDSVEYKQKVKEIKLRKSGNLAIDTKQEIIGKSFIVGIGSKQFETFTQDMFKSENMFKTFDDTWDEKPLEFTGGGILEAIKDMTPNSRSISMDDADTAIKRMQNEPIPMGAKAIEQYNQFWDKQVKELIKDGTIIIEEPIAQLAKKLNINFNTAKHIYILEFLKGVQYKGLHKIDRYKTLIENIRSAIYEDKFDPESFIMVKSRNIKTVSTEDAIIVLMNYYKITDMTYSYKDFITTNTKFKTNHNIKQDMARNRRDKKKKPIKYAKP